MFTTTWMVVWDRFVKNITSNIQPLNICADEKHLSAFTRRQRVVCPQKPRLTIRMLGADQIDTSTRSTSSKNTWLLQQDLQYVYILKPWILQRIPILSLIAAASISICDSLPTLDLSYANRHLRHSKKYLLDQSSES